MLCSVALFASLFAASAGAAPGDVTASEVANIAPGVTGSDPGQFIGVNGIALFAATDGTNGTELWKTDGTSAGTTMVVGGGGINPTGSSNPHDFVKVNGTVYFGANDGAAADGTELWKTDGTAAGTTMVDDDVVPDGGINPGAGNANPSYLADVNGTLYFRATSAANGTELWKTDGTAAGTTMIAPFAGGINPGSSSSNPRYMTDANGTVFFAANDGTNGEELWKSNGTAVGTTMVVPPPGINPGVNAGSSPYSLTNINGTLFFAATNGADGAELWKSDGTSGGTTMVPAAGINPGPTTSDPDWLVKVGSTLFLSAFDVNGNELWKSDGTDAGTTMVAPGGGINPSSDANPYEITDVNGTAFFGADDGTDGFELWKSNGTPAGTTLIAPVAGGLAPGATGSSPENFAAVNGMLFFEANDGSDGTELWQSDGTSAGTKMVDGGLVPGAGDSVPDNLANVNGTLFFAADNGTDGHELWKATIEAAPPSSTPPAATATAPTGQRAAALKKCKKKKSSKARSKCKKKAKSLPV